MGGIYQGIASATTSPSKFLESETPELQEGRGASGPNGGIGLERAGPGEEVVAEQEGRESAIRPLFLLPNNLRRLPPIAVSSCKYQPDYFFEDETVGSLGMFHVS